MDLRTLLEKDPPFSYHSPNPHNKRILVGAEAAGLRALIAGTYRLSLVNPVITAIVGQPGSGKTHFIHNLEARSTEGEASGAVVIYDLKDATPSVGELLLAILRSPTFQAKVGRLGVQVPSGPPEKTQGILTEVVNRAKDRDPDFGIILAVDAVDEHIRQLVGSGRFNRQEAVGHLVGAFRLLMDALPSVCILLALTADAYAAVSEVVRGDQTLRRRFLVPNGPDGEPARFGTFESHEAEEMVSAFLRSWGKRNGLPPTLWVHDSRWPFTKEAVELLWKATPSPGGLSLLCYDALLDAVASTPEDTRTIDTLAVAKVLRRNREHPYLPVDDAVWDEVATLLEGPPTPSTSAPKPPVVAAGMAIHFERLGYVVARSEESVTVQRDVRKVLVRVAADGRQLDAEIRTAAEAIMRGSANAGLVLLRGAAVATSYLTVEHNGRDYATVVHARQIPDAAFALLGDLATLEESRRRRVSRHVERQLGLGRLVESLMFAEPARTSVGEKAARGTAKVDLFDLNEWREDE